MDTIFGKEPLRLKTQWILVKIITAMEVEYVDMAQGLPGRDVMATCENKKANVIRQSANE